MTHCENADSCGCCSGCKRNSVVRELADKMHINSEVGMKILAALMYAALRGHSSGITDENYPDVVAELRKGLCSKYEFEVYLMASYSSDSLLDVLYNNEPQLRTFADRTVFFSGCLYPYLAEHEIIPGVRFEL